MTTTIETAYVPTETDRELAAMLTENTGRHMLDSGGAYGRNWERNTGASAETFHAMPRASIDRYGCITVNVFHYLRDRLEYDRELTERFLVFAAESDDPWYSDMCAWVDYLQETKQLDENLRGYGDGPTSWNTYNGEDYLSQVVQGITFTLADGREPCAIVQIHGGCDVRGGYTQPRVFRVTTYDAAEYFPHDNADATIYCTRDSYGPAVIVRDVDITTTTGETVTVPELAYVTECGFAIDIRGAVDYSDRDGCFTDWRPNWNTDLDYQACPICGAPLAADAPYAG